MTPAKIISGLFLALFFTVFLFESCDAPVEINANEVPSWDIPNDLSPNSSEAAFDKLAWKTFIALNWPVNASGSGPDTTQTIPQDDNNYKTVWESYTESYDIYTKGPGNYEPLPSNCPKDTIEKVRNHKQASKVGIATEFIEAAPSDEAIKKSPLIDLNSEYVRYEVLYNSIMKDYVDTNKTYNKEGLDNFKLKHKGLDFDEGSLVVKAAWKVLGKNDKPDDFFTSHSYMVYIQDRDTITTKTPDTPYCSLDYVGLVGMHIAWKTPDHPNWIWMTFEHKNNDPDSTATLPTSGSYNFYNPNRDGCGVGCINKYPDHPAGLDYYTPAVPNQTPSQIARVTPIREDVVTTNSQFHSKPLISNSIWKNYNLVGVQWTKAKTPTSSPFVIEPDTFLANTAIETWDQSTASCMGCHQLNAAHAFLDTTLTADYMWSAFKALNDDPTENQKGAEN